ncbi:hypothetical protein EDD85DRAFT_963130 [Armillaria nabsnona]|nr:hypothetical protein EDD85DRAFT_963130 [Armillaria nabsnona]
MSPSSSEPTSPAHLPSVGWATFFKASSPPRFLLLHYSNLDVWLENIICHISHNITTRDDCRYRRYVSRRCLNPTVVTLSRFRYHDRNRARVEHLTDYLDPPQRLHGSLFPRNDRPHPPLQISRPLISTSLSALAAVYTAAGSLGDKESTSSTVAKLVVSSPPPLISLISPISPTTVTTDLLSASRTTATMSTPFRDTMAVV